MFSAALALPFFYQSRQVVQNIYRGWGTTLSKELSSLFQFFLLRKTFLVFLSFSKELNCCLFLSSFSSFFLILGILHTLWLSVFILSVLFGGEIYSCWLTVTPSTMCHLCTYSWFICINANIFPLFFILQKSVVILLFCMHLFQSEVMWCFNRWVPNWYSFGS